MAGLFMPINLRKLSKRLAVLLVVTATATITFAAYAAFIEPSVGPQNSTQDFTQNILGANNANNSFDSTGVAANNNGSIIERLEYIQSQL